MKMIEFKIKRYFASHKAIVIFSPENKIYRNRIIRIFDLLKKKWKNTYFFDIKDVKNRENEIANVLYKAKLLIIEKGSDNSYINNYKKYIDYFEYDGIFDDNNNLKKMKFLNKKNKNIIKSIESDEFESVIYNKEIKAILSFVRFNGKDNFGRRLAESCLKGRVFTFFSPNSILKFIYICFDWILNKLSLILDKTFGYIVAYIFLYVARRCYKNKKIQKKVVIRTCHHQYNCNPKYIAQYLLKNYPSVKIVWILQQHKYTNISAFPAKIQLVRNNSLKALFHLSTAKIFIDNSIISNFVSRRNGQTWIQTWHGSLGIKRFDVAWGNEIAVFNNKNTSFCISNSTFEDDVYKGSYWPDVPIKRFGHPRNDIFFEDRTVIREKVCRILQIPSHCKILLFGPTFRDQDRAQSRNDIIENLSYYNLNYKNIIKSLEQKFGGEWVIIERFHFHLKKFSNFNTTFTSGIYNASAYPDMQELMAASDAAITDYSSWIFDFMLSRRPAFIFAEDMKNYQLQRSFYYPLESTPFPLAKTSDGVVDNILSFDEKKYKQDVEAFLKEKGCVDDGKASERVGKFIINLLEE